MASSSCLPTTGEAEAAFLSALISGSSAQEATIPALLQKGVECKPTSMLPGTNGTDPDSFDLDGYAMLLSLEAFKSNVPLVFNVTVGGLTVPASSKTIEENHGYRFIGCLNCNTNVHAPCSVYSGLMWELRACQPADAGSGGASRTNKKTYPVEALLAAMERANCAFVIINCYGLEDRVLLNSVGGADLKPSQQYIKNWADESLGFRVDIGGVWLNGGSTSYISLPGSPVGIELYTIGAPLQSMASFMRSMQRKPEKFSEYSGGGWKGGTITAQVNFLRATAGANAKFRISNARSGTAAGAFRNQGVLTPISERGGHSTSPGVTSVVMYNGGQKHNMVSLLNNGSNSSGFEFFGTGRTRAPCRSGAPEEAPLPSRAPWGIGEVESPSGAGGNPLPPPTPTPLAPAALLPPALPPPFPPQSPPPPLNASTAASTARRAMARDVEALTKLTKDAKKFPEAEAGGIRAEAHIADGSPSPGSFLRAIADGIGAVRFIGDSSLSGCRATAVISKSTADSFNSSLVALASQQVRGGTNGRELVQGVVNQLGMYCPKHSGSRKFFFNGTLWVQLYGAARCNVAVALREESPEEEEQQEGTRGNTHSSSSSGGGGTGSEGWVQVSELLLWGPDSWDKASRVRSMCQWEHQELLAEPIARKKLLPPPGSVIKVSASVDRFYGLSKDTESVHIAVVPGGDGSKATIAVGTFACCCFAVELAAAFMYLANKNAYRVSEKISKKFQFARGENGAKAFRVPNASGQSISAEALALANSPVARVLVWPHFQGANDSLEKIEGLLPTGKSDLPRAKSAYIECQKEAAGDWKKFRQSVIQFLRARHVALCSVGNESACILPGEPHPFFFSRSQASGRCSEVPGERGARQRGNAAEEGADKQAGLVAASAEDQGGGEQEEEEDNTGGHAELNPQYSRYEEFRDVLLRITRCPFEISLPHIVQKVNASEDSRMHFEESEAISHLKKMGASKLGISIGENGKVSRSEL